MARQLTNTDVPVYCIDRDRCDMLFEKLLRRAGKAVRNGAERFEVTLLDALPLLPSIDVGLVQLDRFLDATFGPSSLIEDLIGQPGLLDSFFRLTVTSAYIGDILVREPELFRWLTTTDVLTKDAPRDVYRQHADEAMHRFETLDKKLNALRAFHRREMLRIAGRDILTCVDLSRTCRDLSFLADAIVQTLFAFAKHTIEKRYSVSISTPIVLLALGKLGGEELNYSSDIDLMAVYSENNIVTPSLTVHDLVVRTLEYMIRCLTDVSSEGFFYRTDFRLRPDGGAGALALSFSATQRYYESRGAQWEQQMLIKARVVAGDAHFGTHVLEMLRTFSYHRARWISPPELMGEIRTRLQQRWKQAQDIKHGEGGIRQIEFIVQALQLLHGQDDPDIRQTGTLPAIDALEARGHINADEAAYLTEAYRFFRRVEHMLQLERFEQTHTLPESMHERSVLAWRMGHRGWEEMEKHLHGHRAHVNTVFASVFESTGGTGDAQAMLTAERFVQLGFRDPGAAMQNALFLKEGRVGSMHRASLAKRISGLLPNLLLEIVRGPLPDQALRGIEQFFSQTPSPEAVVMMMENKAVQTFLVLMATHAPVQLRRITTAPIVLDSVMSGGLHSSLVGVPIHTVKLLRETRAFAKFLHGDIDIQGYVRELTDAADESVRIVLKEMSLPDEFPFCIIALGKYGGRELSPGSDLDVIFLFQEIPGYSLNDAQEVAKEFIRRMQEYSIHGALYTIDARLRPEGKSSPLVTTLDAYHHYLVHRASLWEKQSLLKARVIHATSGMKYDVERLIRTTILNVKPGRDEGNEIREMRSQMEPLNRFRMPGFFDLKLSSGGLVDTEYAVQVLQLAHCNATPDVLTGNTFEALRTLCQCVPDVRNELHILDGHYRSLRTMQLVLRLIFDTPSNILPSEKEKMEVIGRIIFRVDPMRVDGIIETLRKETRDAYEKIVQSLEHT